MTARLLPFAFAVLLALLALVCFLFLANGVWLAAAGGAAFSLFIATRRSTR